MFRYFHAHQRRAVVVLTVLLAFQCLGWLVAWQVARQEVRWTMQRSMRTGEVPLHYVTLSAAELPHLRVDRHEIRLNGRLYDIRSQEFSGDSVHLVLCHDVREERLLATLGTLLTGADMPGSGPVSPLRSWWIQWFGAAFLPPASLLWRIGAPPVDQQCFLLLRLPAAQAGPDCLSPPPKRAYLRS